jgi:hypothetical protein
VDETNAILRQEAPDLPPDLAGIRDPAALNRIVRRCLAKPAEDRFESARDLAFSLESILEQGAPKPAPNRPRNALLGTVAAAVLAIGALLAVYLFRGATSPAYQRLTFRRGIVSAARFTPDGNTIVYSAAWDTGDFRLYATRRDGAESYRLEHVNGMLFAVSSNSDLALCEPTGHTQHGMVGKLTQAPFSGGGPLVKAEDVSAADWSPDGSKLAVGCRMGARRSSTPSATRSTFPAATWKLSVSRHAAMQSHFWTTRCTTIRPAGWRRSTWRGTTGPSPAASTPCAA